MEVTTAEPRAHAALLPLHRRIMLRRLAVGAVVFAMVLTGTSIALKVPVLKPYPGTEIDPVMKALAYTVFVGLLATLFKVGWVPALGPWMERRLGTRRHVKLRHVFSSEIFWVALWGGLLQAVWSVMFIALVVKIAPSALAAGRALVIIPLAILELVTRVLPRGDKRVYVRLATSLLVTFTGAGTAIFAGGFHLFAGEPNSLYLWLFVALLGPGNFLLALAEQAELKGVNKPVTAASVYTLARFVYFTSTCAVAVCAWGLLKGSWSVVWAVGEMLYDRWPLILPLAILGGAADLLRICVKVVIPATYMYVVGAFAVVVEGVIQTICKIFWPDVYNKVPGGWVFPTLLLFGGLVIVVGAWLFPHPKRQALPEPTGTFAAVL